MVPKVHKFLQGISHLHLYLLYPNEFDRVCSPYAAFSLRGYQASCSRYFSTLQTPQVPAVKSLV
jgi:hypothetical protein